ncbi:uncharacterized protein LOC131201010 isoform X3 [Ahaetulla prasina]|uniref:uncharacterized protein LOC131201010 isoform X3 n=1 Tax=Ahaetulla prasina TaxID=499056 RepID=UPI00264759B0|nr:uncharacterized protein LOC131201010 isoform X3 [Ahaetulla prasina]
MAILWPEDGLAGLSPRRSRRGGLGGFRMGERRPWIAEGEAAHRSLALPGSLANRAPAEEQKPSRPGGAVCTLPPPRSPPTHQSSGFAALESRQIHRLFSAFPATWLGSRGNATPGRFWPLGLLCMHLLEDAKGAVRQAVSAGGPQGKGLLCGSTYSLERASPPPRFTPIA